MCFFKKKTKKKTSMSLWCGKDMGVLFWKMNLGPSRGIQPGCISDICLIVIQHDFPSTRSLIVSVWQRPIQKNEMSSERLILSPQLSTHNYLDGTGPRDIVKEYRAVISARFFCNELTPVAVKQQCITGTDRFHFTQLSVVLSWETAAATLTI